MLSSCFTPYKFSFLCPLEKPKEVQMVERIKSYITVLVATASVDEAQAWLLWMLSLPEVQPDVKLEWVRHFGRCMDQTKSMREAETLVAAALSILEQQQGFNYPMLAMLSVPLVPIPVVPVPLVPVPLVWLPLFRVA
jgi:hypothetical protein